MNIKLADKITNEELRRITKQNPTEIQIKKMELDRTHITYRRRSNRETRIRLESSGVQKKR
jgi:hypothetical protein